MSHAQLTRIAVGLRPGAEEVANSFTHGIGAALSIAAAAVLMGFAWAASDVWRILGCAIYAFALIGVYVFSTLSHAVADPHPKRALRVLDQAFIYLLIAGTYTPFALAYLRRPAWWVFFAVVWMLAFCGFFSKVLMGRRIDRVAVWFYVVLGWMLAVAVKPLLGIVPIAGLSWMVVGGLCYTAGTFFLINDERHNYYHAVWHLFVIAGSAWQFFAVLFFVGMVD